MNKMLNVKYYIASGVALAAIFIYLPALQNEFVAWDDNIYVFANPYISSLNMRFIKWAFCGFYGSNWHPLTWISHALDYAIWGLNPLGHHLTSVILHGINSFIVVLLIIKLLEVLKGRTQAIEPMPFLHERSILIAGGVTGLLFGLHPLHVESVAWVAERKDLLCALFFMLSIMQYTDYAKTVSDGSALGGLLSRYYNKHYLSTALFFILALLSKPMAVTLPVVLLILDWYPFQRIQSFQTFRQTVVEKIPLLVLSLLSSIITVLAQKAGGALSLIEVVPLSIRLLVSAKSLILYLLKLLWPLNLVPFYPYPKQSDMSALFISEYLLSIAIIIGITAVCIVFVKKQKLWLAVWGFYIVTLIPVLGILQVGGQSMADRYMYLPSLGPFLVIGLIAAWTVDKMVAVKRLKTLKIILSSAVVFLFIGISFLTYKQIDIWKSSIEFWNYVIKKEPDRIFFAYNNRGLALGMQGRFQEAIADFDKAIILDPYYSVAYDNRGMFSGTIGQYDSAIRDFTMAINLDPVDYRAYDSRAVTFEKMGQFEKALDDYNTAVTLNPSFQEAFYHLGILYGKMGLHNEAIQSLNKSIALNPSNVEAYSNRGVMYSLNGQPEQALEDYNKAIALNQNFATAYLNRGNLYLKSGRKDMAFADFQRACALGDAIGCKALY
jgi:protein O-mannosyl-transferase